MSIYAIFVRHFCREAKQMGFKYNSLLFLSLRLPSLSRLSSSETVAVSQPNAFCESGGEQFQNRAEEFLNRQIIFESVQWSLSHSF